MNAIYGQKYKPNYYYRKIATDYNLYTLTGNYTSAIYIDEPLLFYKFSQHK